ncbi:MAG: RICIN domain-containing protein, partial [Acetanaerobacterium sp.]
GATYTIQNYGSEKMLNIYNAGTIGNGINVVQWTADGSTEQKWMLQSGSSSGTYNLCSKFDTDLVLDAYSPMRPIPSGVNADIWEDNDPHAQSLRITELSGGRCKIALAGSSSLVLTARGSSNGSAGGKSPSSAGNVYWSTYSSSNHNQQWIMEEVSNTDRHSPPAAGLYNLVNGNGANLNVYAGIDQNGTSLVMWENDGSTEQQFVLSNLNGRSKLYARCSSNGNNRVVDAYRPSGAVQSGAKAEIWENNDPVSQEMVITPLGSNYYKISLKSDNSLAITASRSTNNASVTFSNYTGATAQKWKFSKVDPNANGALDTHNPPSTGIYNIVSSNGAYLNVYAGRDVNLTSMVMWAGDGSVDQQFRLGSYGEGSKLYAMCSLGGNSRVLDAYRPSGAVANGAKAQLYDSNDDISQILTITPKGNGLYKIALNSNKTLALTASGSANNSRVTYSVYTGAPGQLWQLEQITPIDLSTHEPPSEGVYNLINSNGAYLNVYAGTDANGTKAVMWAGDGSVDQKFRLSNNTSFSRLYAMCSFGGAGRVLDAYKPGQYVLNGTTAEIWNPTDDTAQLLCISEVGTKYKVALQSNTSLALTASGSANNCAVTYTTYTEAANQLWTLQRISDWEGEPVPDSFSIEYDYTENCYPDRNGFKPLAWVCHIADGTLNGTIAWFHNPDSEVSSNYVIGRDGRIVEMVPVNKAAWANGTKEDSSSNAWWGNSTSELVHKNKSNANYYTISIEFEGYWNVTKGAISTAQRKAAVWLMKYVRSVYRVDIPFDRDHILGHYQINPITRPNCPGELFPFDQLIEELGGNEIPGIPETGGGNPIYFWNMYFIKNV